MSEVKTTIEVMDDAVFSLHTARKKFETLLAQFRVTVAESDELSMARTAFMDAADAVEAFNMRPEVGSIPYKELPVVERAELEEHKAQADQLAAKVLREAHAKLCPQPVVAAEPKGTVPAECCICKWFSVKDIALVLGVCKRMPPSAEGWPEVCMRELCGEYKPL